MNNIEKMRSRRFAIWMVGFLISSASIVFIVGASWNIQGRAIDHMTDTGINYYIPLATLIAGLIIPIIGNWIFRNKKESEEGK